MHKAKQTNFPPIEAEIFIQIGGKMNSKPANKWSDRLKQQTRELIESQGLDFPLIDTKIHMKHIESRYGYIELAKLISGNIIVVDKNTGTETHFDNAEELINAGWAID